MIMQKLITLIGEMCQKMGYEFYVGPQREINSTVTKFPIAWLENPSLCNIEGCNQGIATYSVSLYLMEALDAENKAVQSAKLDENALVLYNNLALSGGVNNVDDLETTIDFLLFPPLGEISAHLEFEIGMDFKTKIKGDD